MEKRIAEAAVVASSLSKGPLRAARSLPPQVILFIVAFGPQPPCGKKSPGGGDVSRAPESFAHRALLPLHLPISED